MDVRGPRLHIESDRAPVMATPLPRPLERRGSEARSAARSEEEEASTFTRLGAPSVGAVPPPAASVLSSVGADAEIPPTNVVFAACLTVCGRARA